MHAQTQPFICMHAPLPQQKRDKRRMGEGGNRSNSCVTVHYYSQFPLLSTIHKSSFCVLIVQRPTRMLLAKASSIG